MTTKHLIRKYLDFKCLTTKATSANAVSYLIGRHIEPWFLGSDANKDFNRVSVERWYLSKANSQTMSAECKNRIFAVMRELITKAWNWKAIDSETYQDACSIITNVRVPNKAKSEKAVWTNEQESAFLSAIPHDNDYDLAMFNLFFDLGCRMGELLGLQWGCLDSAKGTIEIKQQAVYQKGGVVITNQLKTNNSYRRNELCDDTMYYVNSYREKCGDVKASDLMFPSPYDKKQPLSRTELRRRFKEYTEKAGLPPITPHGIRHSKATMLASVVTNAEEVKVVASALGHSSKVFMDTYVNGNSVSQREIKERLVKKNG